MACPLCSYVASGLRRTQKRSLILCSWLCLEPPSAWLGDQTRHLAGSDVPCAVGGDAGVGVHLAIQLGNEHERQTALHGLQEARPSPDRRQAVEAVPRFLRELTNLLGTHRRMR